MFCFKVKKLELSCCEVAKISISSPFLSLFNLYPFLFFLFFLMLQFFGMLFIWNEAISSLFFFYCSNFWNAVYMTSAILALWWCSGEITSPVPPTLNVDCVLIPNVMSYTPVFRPRKCRQIITTVWMSYLLIIFLKWLFYLITNFNLQL